MKTTIELTPENVAALAKYPEFVGHTPAEFIFSAVIFLAISSLLLCSCSDVDQPQSQQSPYSKIPGSGAVSY